MRKISFQEKKKIKKLNKMQYKHFIDNCLMNKLMKFVISTNEQYKKYNIIICDLTDGGYFGSAHYFNEIITLSYNYTDALNNINMVDRFEKTTHICLNNYDINMQKVLMGIYIILHEIGHMIHFEKLMTKRQLDFFNICDKIKFSPRIHNIYNRDERRVTANKKLWYEIYLNSIFEKAADKHVYRHVNILHNVIANNINF